MDRDQIETKEDALAYLDGLERRDHERDAFLAIEERLIEETAGGKPAMLLVAEGAVPAADQLQRLVAWLGQRHWRVWADDSDEMWVARGRDPLAPPDDVTRNLN